MFRPCSRTDCVQTSRTLCYCCNENFCHDHFNEHIDLFQQQLHPLSDQVNLLIDQLNGINTDDIVGGTNKQLDAWRVNVHHTIEQLINDKRSAITRHVNETVNHQRSEIHRIRESIKELDNNKTTNMKSINAISLDLRTIGQNIMKLVQHDVNIDMSPFELYNQLMQILMKHDERNIDLAETMPIVNAIDRNEYSFKAIASNSEVVLFHRNDHLCLVNKDFEIIYQIQWSNSWIWDMSWSSAIDRFILLTLECIFTLNPTTKSIESVQKADQFTFGSCTCSPTALFIVTNEMGSSLLKYQLVPTIELVIRWQSDDLCQSTKIIQDILHHEKQLAFIVENRHTHVKRIEVRSDDTFEYLWSIQFDHVDPCHNAYHLSMLNNNEWLVIDRKLSHLLRVSKHGQLKSRSSLSSISYRACQFGEHFFVISTNTSVQFHSLRK
jgi:hypothetical protein